MRRSGDGHAAGLLAAPRVTASHAPARGGATRGRTAARPLYTPAERARRDRSPWTAVQGVLAAAQFLVFLVSLALVLHALATGRGYGAAQVSVVVKTLALYAIMVTGAAWEKAVFGRWLFADAFFWEDVVSMLVIALHTAYLAALGFGLLAPRPLLALALAAYASYAVNAGQFLFKFRRARRDAGRDDGLTDAVPAGAVA